MDNQFTCTHILWENTDLFTFARTTISLSAQTTPGLQKVWNTLSIKLGSSEVRVQKYPTETVHRTLRRTLIALCLFRFYFENIGSYALSAESAEDSLWKDLHPTLCLLENEPIEILMERCAALVMPLFNFTQGVVIEIEFTPDYLKLVALIWINYLRYLELLPGFLELFASKVDSGQQPSSPEVF